MYSCTNERNDHQDAASVPFVAEGRDSMLSTAEWSGSGKQSRISLRNCFYKKLELRNGTQGILQITEIEDPSAVFGRKRISMRLIKPGKEVSSPFEFEASEYEIKKSVLAAHYPGEPEQEENISLYELESGRKILECSYNFMKILYSGSKDQSFWGYSSKAAAKKDQELEQDALTAGVLSFGSTATETARWLIRFKDSQFKKGIPDYTPEMYFESEAEGLTMTDENRGMILSGVPGNREPAYSLVLVFYNDQGKDFKIQIPVKSGKADFTAAVYQKAVFEIKTLGE